MNDLQELYLDLVKRSVTNFLYGPTEPRFDEHARLNGKDLPPTAHTMVGLKRLDGLLRLIEDVLKQGVTGDLVEAGTWRGGSSILMRAALKAFAVGDRTVWVADSFEGMPVPNAAEYPMDADSKHYQIQELIVPLQEVRSNFARYGLLDSQVLFLKGRFCETLHAAPIGKIALLCLDGGMYESTWNALDSLFPKVSPGGFIIVNDYVLEPSRKAVEDYRRVHGITERIWSLDWSGGYWQRALSKKRADALKSPETDVAHEASLDEPNSFISRS